MPSKRVSKLIKLKRVRVRCLGPGREHTFLSTDPKRNRICFKCEQAMRAVSKLQGGAPLSVETLYS